MLFYVLFSSEETDQELKLVMERGTKDLAWILKNARARNSQPISPFTIQHYWQGMLLAVLAIHQEGNVLLAGHAAGSFGHPPGR